MAKLRKFICYRHMERPYTRFSKYTDKNYVRARPQCRVVNFTIGDSNAAFDTSLHLVAKTPLQIRDNAIESARQSCNRVLEGQVGKGNYFMQTRMYPHHILRENPLASGAGADRLSTGMARPFGKPIGVAAQVYAGKPVFTVRVNKPHIDIARLALKRASYKLPCQYRIVIEKTKTRQERISRVKTGAKKAKAAAA
jgi:large subunit ribosomal protein L10e